MGCKVEVKWMKWYHDIIIIIYICIHIYHHDISIYPLHLCSTLCFSSINQRDAEFGLSSWCVVVEEAPSTTMREPSPDGVTKNTLKCRVNTGLYSTCHYPNSPIQGILECLLHIINQRYECQLGSSCYRGSRTTNHQQKLGVDQEHGGPRVCRVLELKLQPRDMWFAKDFRTCGVSLSWRWRSLWIGEPINPPKGSTDHLIYHPKLRRPSINNT